MSINNATPTFAPELSSRSLISKPTKSNASASLISDQDHQDTLPVSPFVKLPPELRNRIYRYLLCAVDDIFIRALDADSLEPPEGVPRRHYRDKHGDWKACGDVVTYRVIPSSVHPAILAVNRQTYLEASKIFYSENRFNFCAVDDLSPPTAIEAIIPFLEDRPEGSRRLIKNIKFSYIPMALMVCLQPYIAESNADFKEICDYLSQNLQLEHVRVRLVVGSNEIMQIDILLACCLCNMGMYKSKGFLYNLDKDSWIIQLVPLVRKLKTFRIVEGAGGVASLARAAQIYLESEMHQASKTVRETRHVQELAHDPAASEE